MQSIRLPVYLNCQTKHSRGTLSTDCANYLYFALHLLLSLQSDNLCSSLCSQLVVRFPHRRSSGGSGRGLSYASLTGGWLLYIYVHICQSNNFRKFSSSYHNIHVHTTIALVLFRHQCTGNKVLYIQFLQSIGGRTHGSLGLKLPRPPPSPHTHTLF